MTTRSIKSLALSIACFAGAIPRATAGGLLVDTGTPDSTVVWAFADWQYFGAEFTVPTATHITGVESFFGAYDNAAIGVGVAYSLHTDEGGAVGSIINTAVLPLSAGMLDYGWYGVSGLNWNIGPGTYWVSFVPGGGVELGMPGVVPNPMAHYAQGGLSGFEYFDVSYLKTGVRIYGDQGSPNNTPDAGATAAMFSAALVILVAIRRRAAS